MLSIIASIAPKFKTTNNQIFVEIIDTLQLDLNLIFLFKLNNSEVFLTSQKWIQTVLENQTIQVLSERFVLPQNEC